MADGRKTVAVDAGLHALWAAEAAKQGVSLASYVTAAVEAVRAGTIALPEGKSVIKVRRNVAVSMPVSVAPKDCTNRLRPGTFCRICQTIHGKG